MFEQILPIINFIIEAFLHIWPYLLVTIPLAAAVQMSGAARYINQTFQARPTIAIFLATAVGAFSPFCSCGVIPVVATLLIGGVPLAPVMSFWIASPSMDPEAFFLSVAALGWELAVWRLAATLMLSLTAGFITHFVARRGWLGGQVLRRRPATAAPTRSWVLLKQGWQSLKQRLALSRTLGFASGRVTPAAELACCASSAPISLVEYRQPAVALTASSCGGGGCGSSRGNGPENSCSPKAASFPRRLLGESWNAAVMVAKFMALAFFLEALITLYVPSEWIAGLLGRQNAWAIVMAALIGVPVYTSNLAALPLISGLLAQGMNPAAALAFLIAGPTTTIPAMAAVWGLATRRVFVLYASFSLLGAVLLGYLYSLAGGW